MGQQKLKSVVTAMTKLKFHWHKTFLKQQSALLRKSQNVSNEIVNDLFFDFWPSAFAFWRNEDAAGRNADGIEATNCWTLLSTFFDVSRVQNESCCIPI